MDKQLNWGNWVDNFQKIGRRNVIVGFGSSVTAVLLPSVSFAVSGPLANSKVATKKHDQLGNVERMIGAKSRFVLGDGSGIRGKLINVERKTHRDGRPTYVRQETVSLLFELQHVETHLKDQSVEWLHPTKGTLNAFVQFSDPDVGSTLKMELTFS